MKTVTTLLALLVQGLFICTTSFAGYITITSDPTSPPNGIIPERALYPLIVLDAQGVDAATSGFDLQFVDSWTNHDIGEIILTLGDYEIGRGSIGTNGAVHIPAHIVYTATNTYPLTVWLRAYSDLQAYTNSGFSVKITAIQADSPISGQFPISSSTFYFSSSFPKIGNIILHGAPRSSSAGVFVNTEHQELGAFTAQVWQNENVVGNPMTFILHGASASNVTLTDNNGNVVAGPVNASYFSEDGSTMITFAGVTFPTGLTTYHLYGKLDPTGLGPNSRIQVTASTGMGSWTLVGASYGYRIEPWSSDITCDMVQVNWGRVFMVITPDAGAAIVPQGGHQQLLSTLEISAPDSMEALGGNAIRLSFTGSVTNVSNVQLYDGTNSLNALHPATIQADGTVNFLLDSQLVLPASSFKNLAIKADIAANAQIGSGVTINFPDNTGNGCVFVGLTTGIAPYVQIPIQFGTTVVIENPAPQGDFAFTANLTYGSTGFDVLVLQRMLHIPQTAHFDMVTSNAVAQFQNTNGIPPTGFFGPLTRGALGTIDLSAFNNLIVLSLERPAWWDSKMTIVARPYTQGIVEVSSDLHTWKQVKTIMTDDTGFASYDGEDVDPQKFYRVVKIQ